MTTTGGSETGGLFGIGFFNTLTTRINELQTSFVDSTMDITRFAAGKIREFKDAFTGGGDSPEETGTSENSMTTLPASHIQALDNFRRSKPMQYRRIVNQIGSGDVAKESALWLSMVE